jgi:hypothetical protein
MPGPQLFRLDSILKILSGKQIFYQFVLLPDHQSNLVDSRRSDRLRNMFDHGNSRNGMDDFGNMRAHAHALAGSQNDC